MTNFNYVNDILNVNRHAPKALDLTGIASLPNAAINGLRNGMELKNTVLKHQSTADSLSRQQAENDVRRQYLQNPAANTIYEPYFNIRPSGLSQMNGYTVNGTTQSGTDRSRMMPSNGSSINSRVNTSRTQMSAKDKEWNRLTEAGFAPQEIMSVLYPKGVQCNAVQQENQKSSTMFDRYDYFNKNNQINDISNPVNEDNFSSSNLMNVGQNVFVSPQRTPVDFSAVGTDTTISSGMNFDTSDVANPTDLNTSYRQNAFSFPQSDIVNAKTIPMQSFMSTSETGPMSMDTVSDTLNASNPVSSEINTSTMSGTVDNAFVSTGTSSAPTVENMLSTSPVGLGGMHTTNNYSSETQKSSGQTSSVETQSMHMTPFKTQDELYAFQEAALGADVSLTPDQRNARILQGVPVSDTFWNSFV
ncbi:MAG: hypothetical protein IKJ28_06840 [Alphaproteobacteria bacterium]|nr:hypothetical protein [Alphaproteobacteria bacterium]